MAIAHADNFSIYGTGSAATAFMEDGVYAQANGRPVTDPDGISSGYVLSHLYGSGNTRIPWRYVLQDGAESTVGIALRTWFSPLPEESNKDRIMQWVDGSNNVLAYLYVTTTGALAMTITGGSTYTSTVPAITAAGWYHIEAKYTHGSGALCSFEVRVEGIAVAGLTQTDVTATDSDISQCSSWRDQISNTSNVYTKDLVIWTGSGSNNTDFLGSVLVTNLAITADVSLNWTPSTGSTGWEILDNIPPVDTDYISADDTPPAAYVGTLSDLPAEVTRIVTGKRQQ
jgi:hypothetical protein